jgi:hypothetical protein
MTKFFVIPFPSHQKGVRLKHRRLSLNSLCRHRLDAAKRGFYWLSPPQNFTLQRAGVV